MVHDGQKTICIWRQIDSNNFWFLVDDMIEKSWILMGKAIVILPPNMTSQQDVETGKVVSPLYIITHLKPLSVLVEHAIDNVDKCLVRIQ